MGWGCEAAGRGHRRNGRKEKGTPLAVGETPNLTRETESTDVGPKCLHHHLNFHHHLVASRLRQYMLGTVPASPTSLLICLATLRGAVPFQHPWFSDRAQKWLRPLAQGHSARSGKAGVHPGRSTPEPTLLPVHACCFPRQKPLTAGTCTQM